MSANLSLNLEGAPPEVRPALLTVAKVEHRARELRKGRFSEGATEPNLTSGKEG